MWGTGFDHGSTENPTGWQIKPPTGLTGTKKKAIANVQTDTSLKFPLSML